MNARVEPIGRHRQCAGVWHMGVEHSLGIRAGAVAAAVDHEGGDLPVAVPINDIPVEVDGDDVIGGHLRPVRAEPVQQKQIGTARYSQREVIVDPLVESMHGSGTKGRSKIMLGARDHIM